MKDAESASSVLAQVRTFLRGMKMVVWAFVGLRKGSDSQEDLVTVKPVHIVVAGLVVGACFIVAIAMLVHWIVAL